MELLNSDHSLIEFLAERQILSQTPFRLLDVGCSGGIAEAFRFFGAHSLQAVGIDPNLDEIARLQAVESNPSVRYIPSYCGLPLDHPFIKSRNGNWWGNNPSHRLSATRALEIRAQQEKTSEELTLENAWGQVRLADRECIVGVDEIVLKEFGGAIDFLKIDVDGADLAVLHSASSTLNSPELLGVCLEVNYHGTEDSTDNTFHNMDRMMRKNGFELFDLTTRHYSAAALPSPFLYAYPAQTHAGRILQGDALYFRDLAAFDKMVAPTMQAPSILKLACLFNLFGLPDCSAELLQSYRSSIGQLVNVEEMLDALAQEAASIDGSYREHISNWEIGIKNNAVASRPIQYESAELLALIEAAQLSGLPLIIWGYGIVGKLIYPHLAPLVAHIVDSNPKLMGIPVGQHRIAPHQSLTPEILKRHTVVFTPRQQQLPDLISGLPKCQILRGPNRKPFSFS